MAIRVYDYEKEPTVTVVKNILTDAINMKVSDIHFISRENKLAIKFRVNGDLIEYTIAPENVKTNIITRVKILSGMNITESNIPQYGSINFDLNSKNHHMRSTSLPVIDGENVVVHLSDYTRNIKGLDKLGLNNSDLDKIKDMLKEENGLILITGTNSSGKTTTMYSLVQELNKKSLSIVTIEDPVKMKIDGVSQIQINPDKGVNYHNAIRSAMLADPNIVVIGELVDDEIARNAVRASLSGRLVISTMHTKTALMTIETLLKMDVENYLLGSNLLGIISQRLVKKLCPNCKEKKKASDYEKHIIKSILGTEVDELYYPKGCEYCQNGYVDQIPVVEVVKMSDELRYAISNKRSKTFIKKAIYDENESILKNGFTKVKNGETSFEEIIRVIDVKNDFDEEQKSIKQFILGNNEEEEEKQEEKNTEINELTKKTKKKVSKENEDKETNDKDDKNDKNDKENKNSKNEDKALLKNAVQMMEERIKEKKEENDKKDSSKEEKDIKEEEVKNLESKPNILNYEVIDEKKTPTEDAYKEEITTNENDDVEIKDDNKESLKEQNIDSKNEEISKDKNDVAIKEVDTDEKEEKIKSIIAIANDDDDNDDDSFEYGDGYINSF